MLHIACTVTTQAQL